MKPPPPIVENPLFFLDYDGTLAPIIDDPARAFPHPDVPDVLRRLAGMHPVVIVTGRFLADLDAFLDEPLEAVGLHGMQRGRIGGPSADSIPEEAGKAIAALRGTAPTGGGVRVEDKGPTFAVHYRLSPDKDAAQDRLREWLSDVPDDLDVIWGKDVVELKPRGISKGTAVSRIAAQHEDRTPIYLGDDVTDEDAFRALGREAVTVKVGDGETAAVYRLSGVDDVVEYLRAYVDESPVQSANL